MRAVKRTFPRSGASNLLISSVSCQAPDGRVCALLMDAAPIVTPASGHINALTDASRSASVCLVSARSVRTPRAAAAKVPAPPTKPPSREVALAFPKVK
jgi:hypothetical protein